MNWNTPIRWGLIGGLADIILTVVIYIVSPSVFAEFKFIIASILFAVFFMVWGGVTFRRENNNEISYWQAFGAVLLVAVIFNFSGILFSYILMNYIDTQLPELIMQAVINNTTEMMEQFGAPDAEIEKALSQIEQSDTSFGLKKHITNFLWMSAFYAAIGLVVAAFIKRNPDNQLTPPTAE